MLSGQGLVSRTVVPPAPPLSAYLTRTPSPVPVWTERAVGAAMKRSIHVGGDSARPGPHGPAPWPSGPAPLAARGGDPCAVHNRPRASGGILDFRCACALPRLMSPAVAILIVLAAAGLAVLAMA